MKCADTAEIARRHLRRPRGNCGPRGAAQIGAGTPISSPTPASPLNSAAAPISAHGPQLMLTAARPSRRR